MRTEKRRAADSLCSEYMNGLYGYAMVLTRNHAEAEDLVQETYVRAIPAMSRLRPESNIKAWLFKILRNIWFNQLRKRRSDPQMVPADMESGPLDNLVNPGQDSYEIYAGEMERRRVRAAIQELPWNPARSFCCGSLRSCRIRRLQAFWVVLRGQ